MNCTNCGKEITDNNVKFCGSCGSPIVSVKTNEQAPAQAATATNEAQNNKVIFILAYLGFLFFLPLVSYPDSKAGRFHANQGLLLLITAIAGQIVISIISSIFLRISLALWTLTSLISFAWGIALLALMIIGMVNANKGELKPLPLIGNFNIIR